MSVFALMICLICTTISFFSKQYTPLTVHHENEYFVKITRYQSWLSLINMVCITTNVAIILLTYFMPRIAGYCLCKYMTVACLTSYVIGFYSLKFAFALHGHFEYMIAHFRDNSQTLDCFQSALSGLGAKIIAGSLFVFGVASAILTNATYEAGCKNNEFGCNISFKRAFGIGVLGAMTMDAGIFGYFMLKVFFKIQGENKLLVRRFVRYWILGSIFVAASLINICINIAYPQYETLVVVLLDCIVMVICNLLAFSPFLTVVDCCCTEMASVGSTAKTSKKIKIITGKSANIEAFDFKTAEIETSDIGAELQTIPEIDAVVGGATSSPKLYPTPASTPPFKGCGSDTSVSMSGLSLAARRSDGLNTLTNLKSSEYEGSSGILRCPRCQKEVLVRDGDDKWERMKMHIIAFHLDDV